MGYLTLRGVSATGNDRYDRGIGDILIAQSPDGPMAYAVTCAGGGISAFRLRAGGSALHSGQSAFSTAISQGLVDQAALVDSNGTLQLLSSQQGAALAGVGINARTGAPTHALTVGLPGMAPNTTAIAAGEGTLVLAGAGGVQLFAAGAGGWSLAGMSPAPLSAPVPEFSALSTAGDTVIAASSVDHSLRLYCIARSPEGNATGLRLTDMIGAERGLGIADPAAIEIVTLAGRSFAIVGSSGSSTLSVFEISPSGRFLPTDQVLDSRFSRFAEVQSVATASVGDHVFVVAGGGDGGLSLFRLLPDGRLLHLETVSGMLGLEKVSAISACVVGEEIQVLVAGQQGAGLLQFAVDARGLGLVLRGGAGADFLVGGDGQDVLTGLAGNDSLSGGDGDDILCDGDGADRLTGGAGADIFVLSGDASRDIITDFDPAKDRLDISAFPMLYDPASLGWIETATGAVFTWRGIATELVRAGSALPITREQGISAILRGPDRPLLLVATSQIGTASADRMTGDWMDDFLQGLDGADTLDGLDGNDTLSGGAGRDLLRAGSGDDSLIGAADADTLFGGPGTDTIDGGDGSDRLYGMEGDDSLHCGSGDDWCQGGLGNDSILGGDGRDWLDAGPGDDTVGGGPGDDVIHGLAGRDRIDSEAGNDTVFAGPDEDTVDGGDGDDLLFAGLGGDHVVGGAGNDEIHGLDGHDRIFAGTGNDTVFAGLGYDTVDAGAGDDVVWGGPGRDLVYLGEGNDFFRDTVQGGAAASDRVYGGSGRDTILSTDGNDQIWGGTEADVFIILAGSGQARIADFARGEDRLRLSVAGLGASTVSQEVRPDGVWLDWGSGRVVVLEGLQSVLTGADMLFG